MKYRALVHSDWGYSLHDLEKAVHQEDWDILEDDDMYRTVDARITSDKPTETLAMELYNRITAKKKGHARVEVGTYTGEEGDYTEFNCKPATVQPCEVCFQPSPTLICIQCRKEREEE